MLKRLLIMGLLCALLSVGGAGAQQADSWEVVLYNETTSASGTSGEFVVIGPAGVMSTLPIPQAVFDQHPGVTSPQISLAPDHVYAALAFYDPNAAGLPPILIANLQTGACCVTVPPPSPTVQAYGLGPFSPDSGQVSLAYVTLGEDANTAYSGALATVN